MGENLFVFEIGDRSRKVKRDKGSVVYKKYIKDLQLGINLL